MKTCDPNKGAYSLAEVIFAAGIFASSDLNGAVSRLTALRGRVD